jgi:hypothetical protein
LTSLSKAKIFFQTNSGGSEKKIENDSFPSSHNTFGIHQAKIFFQTNSGGSEKKIENDSFPLSHNTFGIHHVQVLLNKHLYLTLNKPFISYCQLSGSRLQVNSSSLENVTLF